MNAAELERLYDAHAAGVYHYLMSFTRGEADARDLLQELFIKLAVTTSHGVLRHEKAFVYRLAHNLAVDWLRCQRTQRVAEERLAESAEADHLGAVDPDMVALSAQLAQALNTLPEEQRSVLQLKLWEGMTFEEIAAVQGIPLNTAASRHRYGLEKLRTLLRPIYEELT